MAAPGATRHKLAALEFLGGFGFEKVVMAGAVSEPGAVLAAFAGSETLRWLRRWAVVAVVALITPLPVITAYADEMPEFHHVAVAIAVAVIVPAWVPSSRAYAGHGWR